MGEVEAVLNGVQFRTRHNDYLLKQKSTTSMDYNAVQTLEFPDVPTEESDLETPEEQIEEMALWLKAFKDQDDSVRDYKKYFQPALCYLEGGWTTSDGKIEESFESDRHFLDAKTWFQMQENIRFTAFTGSKDSLENFSYLPTKIFQLINGTIPMFAQWNYRILCHKLSKDLPTNRLRIVEDLTTMMAHRKSKQQIGESRAARFTLNTKDSDTFNDGKDNYGLLDRMMYEIPGKDNYMVDIEDNYGAETYTYEDANERLNPGLYHRWYSTKDSDAGGRSTRHRGFNDANVFFAMTSNDKIASMSYETCKGKGKRRTCQKISQKWTYAIPLEIIYLTPLFKWNPYNIEYKIGDAAKTVTEGGRNGKSKPLDGTSNKYFFRTPAALFQSKVDPNKDAADTVKGSVKVLDSNGDVRETMASGTRIHINAVKGFEGSIRTRYPIAPIYAEGNSIFKELEALKDIVLNSEKYSFALNQPLQCSSDCEGKPTNEEGPSKEDPVAESKTLETGPGVQGHKHEVIINSADMALLKIGKKVTIESELVLGHTHTLIVRFDKRKRYRIVKCDGLNKCKDKHDKWLVEI